jgi:hypothetical protein
MANQWDDQPANAEGDQVLHIGIGGGYSVQVQTFVAAAGRRYSITVGNLFKSATQFAPTLDAAIELVQRAYDKNVGITR